MDDGKLAKEANLADITKEQVNGAELIVFKYKNELSHTIREFKDREFTEEELQKFLEENNYPHISKGDLEDLIAEFKQSEVIEEASKYVLSRLSEMRIPNTFVHSPKEIDEIQKENEKIQIDILNSLSEMGIYLYDLASVISTAKRTLNSIMQEMQNRVDNRISEIERVATINTFGTTKVPFKEAEQFLQDTLKKAGVDNVYSYMQRKS